MVDKKILIDSLLTSVKQLEFADENALDRIERQSRLVIGKIFGSNSSYINDLSNISFYTSFSPSSQEEDRKAWERGKAQLLNLLVTIEDDLVIFKNSDESVKLMRADKIVTTEKSLKKVFIVHGHDGEAKNEIDLFLRENGFEPIVLHRQVDEGKTLIEKLEKHSDVAYAIIIATPDDMVIGSGSSLNKITIQEGRARQNVIFEWGYFIGRFGRDKVCCVYKQGVVLPGDLGGLLYKPYQHSVNEIKYELLKELKAAGLLV